MKVNLNLTPKLQGFGMRGNAQRITNNGIPRAANNMQQRAQNVQDAYYNYKNQQLKLMVDMLWNGNITDPKKRPTLGEDIMNDPRISKEVKNKAALYDEIENGQVVVKRGHTGHL